MAVPVSSPPSSAQRASAPAAATVSAFPQPTLVSAFAQLAGDSPHSRRASLSSADKASAVSGSTASSADPAPNSADADSQQRRKLAIRQPLHNDLYGDRASGSGGVPSVREAILGLQRRFGSLDLEPALRPARAGSHADASSPGSSTAGLAAAHRAASVPIDAVVLPVHPRQRQEQRQHQQEDRQLPALRWVHPHVIHATPHIRSPKVLPLVHLMAAWHCAALLLGIVV